MKGYARSEMHRALIGAMVVLASFGTAFSLAVSSSAGASSATHHPVGIINGSAAVENSVRVSFNCESSSGQWSFSISNVQVINADHMSPWTSFSVAFTYGKSPNVQSHTVVLAQDLHNGLFDGSERGSDGPLNSFCATASSFKVVDTATNGANLYVIANIR